MIPRPLADILELARWAPSGDNTQPWRFEVLDAHRLAIHGFDTRAHCVYDLDGHPSQIAHGALLETLAIAATTQGLRMQCRRRAGTPETHPVYDVELLAEGAPPADPLSAFITQRTVQRRALRTTPLSADQKRALQDALGADYSVRWFETAAARWRLARLMFANARLRLTLPEAYPVHRDVIAWRARFSEERVPDQALGLDAMTLRLMKWVMASWTRVRFFNTWLAGHLVPRIEMDLLPGVFCAAHFALVARGPLVTADDYVAAGRAVQRFWLTAASLGLQLQPEITPLVFGRYVREGRRFSEMAGAHETAARLGRRLAHVLQDVPAERVAFLGRIGSGPPARSRSLRKAVAGLLEPAQKV